MLFEPARVRQCRRTAGLLLALMLAAVSTLAAPSAQEVDPLDRIASELRSADPFLPVEQAFRLTGSAKEDGELEIYWQIAPNYYLYRQSIAVEGASLREELPEGIAHYDEFFGDSHIFLHELQVKARSNPGEELFVRWQGCAKAGLCYPPQRAKLVVDDTGGISFATAPPRASDMQPVKPIASLDNAWQGGIFIEGSLLVVLGFYLLAGLLTALTPCVYPVLPLTIYALREQKKPVQSALLYALGLSLVYAALGGVVAVLGAQFTSQLQSPFVLMVMIGLMLYLAGASFGFWRLDLAALIARHSPKLVTAKPASSALLYGSVSGVLLGPCAAPAWVGALLYIATTGDVLLGLLALFVMGLGLSLPVVLGAKLVLQGLLKNGAWMQRLPHVMGFGLVAGAIWIADRFVPSAWVQALWLSLALAVLVWIWRRLSGEAQHRLWRGSASALVVLAALLLPRWGETTSSVHLTEVAAHQELLTLLEEGDRDLTLVYVYADWCVECPAFEREFFGSHREWHDHVNLAKFDATQATPQVTEFMKTYDLLGVPTLMVLDAGNNEIFALRVVGSGSEQEFAQAFASLVGIDNSPTTNT